MGKNNFVMYDDWNEFFKAASDEQAGKLIKAIYQHRNGEECEIDDPMLAGVLNFIKTRLDVDSEAYEKRCNAAAENGKKGGRPKTETENNPTKPNGFSEKPTETQDKAKKGDNEHDNDNDNDKDIKEKENKKKSGGKPHTLFIPPTLEEVRDYCKERNNRVDPQGFIDFYSSKGWMIGKNRMKDWRAAVRTWEQRTRGQPKIEIDDKFRQALRNSEVVDFGM